MNTDTEKITITLPVEVADTLLGLLDGCIGTSENDDFNEQMKPIVNQIKKKIKSFYKQFNNSKNKTT